MSRRSPAYSTTGGKGALHSGRDEAHPLDFAYDCECLFDCFTLTVEHIQTGTRLIFEISARYNHSRQLYDFIRYLQSIDARMVGFNNVGYDYPLVHLFMNLFDAQGDVQARQLWQLSKTIIGAYGDARFQHQIWPSDMLVKQLDLYKVHHFDNRAKQTGLKYLEFQMRSGDIETMQVDWDEPLPIDQIDGLIKYNAHDVRETVKFYLYSLPQIKMRDELTVKYGMDFTNFNDTKIGKQYFIQQLEKEVSPDICFTRVNGRKEPRQTPRDTIHIGSIIQPNVAFNPDSIFTPVLNYLRETTISGHDLKSPPEFKELSAVKNGFSFDFGAGGMHGSIKQSTIREDDTYCIIDLDVEGYYPTVAMVCGLYPEHIGPTFCLKYKELKDERLRRGKKTTEGQMLKLAQNGVYGDSNNPYSPFLDPAYTLGTTINGQLYLCMLADLLMNHTDCQMIQANTDGITVKVRRDQIETFRQACVMWENHTGFKLEENFYSIMCIRDVNNYLAVDHDGNVKRKGAYQWKTDDPTNLSKSLVWHQNWSNLVVPYAAERVVLHGEKLDDVINRHDDAFDFMARTKVPGGSRLTYGKDGPVLQNITRYHAATVGEELYKVMLPTKKKPDADRYFRVNVRLPVNVCNDVTRFDWSILDRSYYVREAQKLIDGVNG